MADATKTSTPVLDLQTLIERPRIAIDGAPYEILSPDEVSVLDHQRLAAWGRRYDALMAQASLSDAERDELARLVRDISDTIMVGVPEAVRARLSDAQRLQVVEVFTALPLQRRLAALAAGAHRQAQDRTASPRATTRVSTGAKPSRGSSASTAATPAGGSASRREARHPMKTRAERAGRRSPSSGRS